MNHKASAECKNGHSFEFGSCNAQVKKVFGIKTCGCNAFEQTNTRGHTTTVSFGDEPWIEVRCMKCKTVYTSRPCPRCGEEVPMSAFKKKGLWAKLG